ncbi:MAG: ATP-binding cassette domain-containing protein [Deltaproteobacteria bacterium]
MLEVKNIEVAYKSVIQVLRGVSLEVGDGKIVALLGANGAGKTTTLKAISGMLKTEEGEVTDGSIEFNGERIDRYGPEHIAALGISQAMEGRRVLEHLSVEENLLVGAYTRKDRARIKRDVEMVFDWFPKIKDLRRQMVSILLVEQNARAALGIAHYGYIIENGRVVLNGPAEQLRNNADVQEFYLGLSALGSKKSYREVKHYRRKKRWLA